jgi:hypothetical protein
VVAAVVIVSNNLICYWFAASWFPVFVSLAWFVWAWAFLARASASRAIGCRALFFCYLTITSGWPQTTIMLGVVCVLAAFQAWRLGGPRHGAEVVAALLAATLLAATAVLALASVTEVQPATAA